MFLFLFLPRGGESVSFSTQRGTQGEASFFLKADATMIKDSEYAFCFQVPQPPSPYGQSRVPGVDKTDVLVQTLGRAGTNPGRDPVGGGPVCVRHARRSAKMEEREKEADSPERCPSREGNYPGGNPGANRWLFSQLPYKCHQNRVASV